MKKIVKYILWFFVSAGLVVIFGPMVVGPFLVKSKNWVAQHANVRMIDSDALDPAIRGYIDDSKKEFESLGFHLFGYMTVIDLTPDTITYFGLFSNQQDMLIGTTVAVTNTAGQAVGYHEITARYADGYAINVSDSPMLGVYTNPENRTYRYPDVHSLKLLYDNHRWIARHDKRSKDPVGLSSTNTIDEINKALDKETQVQASLGYYYLDANDQRFKLTWKGAVIMANRLLFPWRQIREYFDLRTAKEALNGMASANWSEQTAKTIPNIELLKRTMESLHLEDPTQDVDVRITNKDMRFVGIYGYSCSAPGIEKEALALIQKYGVRCLDGTSDYVESEQHRQLIETAISYAEKYNRYLFIKLKSTK